MKSYLKIFFMKKFYIRKIKKNVIDIIFYEIAKRFKENNQSENKIGTNF